MSKIDQEALVFSRLFDAPRALVFKAWTEAERLAQWWGPKNFKTDVKSLNLRTGGEFHYSMQLPNGAFIRGKWIFREIASPERLVFISGFADETGNMTHSPFHTHWPLEILSTIVFEEEDGKTRITMTGIPVDATEAERQAFADAHKSMQQGWAGTLDQLATYLAKN